MEQDFSDLVSMSMVVTDHEKHLDREIMRLVDKEIRIMSVLDHPHVIHLNEVYEDENRVCFVMELAQGGEVFDRLIEKVSKHNLQNNTASFTNDLPISIVDKA